MKDEHFNSLFCHRSRMQTEIALNTYCVVETFENGCRSFAACPSIWILGDILRWPPTNKQLTKMRRECAIPDSTWKNYEIISIKLRNIGIKQNI